MAETAVPFAQLAEQNGYTDVWSAEAGGPDGLTPLAAIASQCPTLRLGTAILPVFTRPAALMAMGAATLQHLSGGRFVLGIGTSSSIIVGKWMGIPFVDPVRRTRETVAVLREALSGKKISHTSKAFSSEGFRLGMDPPAEVPIYLAALGPKMLRLAGEVADGVVLWLFTPEGMRDAVAQVHEGAKAAGRDPASIDVVARIIVAIDEDPQFLRYMLKRMATTYAMVDVYNASLTRQGFEAEAAAIRSAWNGGDREGAVEAVTDEMIERIFVFGDREMCREKLGFFRDAGLKTPVLHPVSVDGDPSERLSRARAMIPQMSGA